MDRTGVYRLEWRRVEGLNPDIVLKWVRERLQPGTTTIEGYGLEGFYSRLSGFRGKPGLLVEAESYLVYLMDEDKDENMMDEVDLYEELSNIASHYYKTIDDVLALVEDLADAIVGVTRELEEYRGLLRPGGVLVEIDPETMHPLVYLLPASISEALLTCGNENVFNELLEFESILDKKPLKGPGRRRFRDVIVDVVLTMSSEYTRETASRLYALNEAVQITLKTILDEWSRIVEKAHRAWSRKPGLQSLVDALRKYNQDAGEDKPLVAIRKTVPEELVLRSIISLSLYRKSKEPTGTTLPRRTFPKSRVHGSPYHRVYREVISQYRDYEPLKYMVSYFINLWFHNREPFMLFSDGDNIIVIDPWYYILDVAGETGAKIYDKYFQPEPGHIEADIGRHRVSFEGYLLNVPHVEAFDTGLSFYEILGRIATTEDPCTHAIALSNLLSFNDNRLVAIVTGDIEIAHPNYGAKRVRVDKPILAKFRSASCKLLD